MSDWFDDALYRQIADEQLIDPLPPEPAMSMLPPEPPQPVELIDDHDVTPVGPGWFLSFDEVDSRSIRTTGAPE